MKGVSLLFLVSAALAAAPADLGNEDLKPEASQQRIHDIIRLHEDYKYGLGNGELDYHDDRPHQVKPQTSYHPVAIKTYTPAKPVSYYQLSTPKYHDNLEYQTLKPVSSKIYSYYPKLDSEEEHGNKHAVVYYPVKDQQYLEEPKYEKYPVQPVYEKHPVVHKTPVHAPAPPQKYVLLHEAPHHGYSSPATHHDKYEAKPYQVQEPQPHPYPVQKHQPHPYPVHDHQPNPYPVQKHHPYPVPEEKHVTHQIVHAPEYQHAPPAEHLYAVPRPKVYISNGPILDDKKVETAYGDQGYTHKEAGYKQHGHGHHGDHGVQELSKHQEHKDYEVKGHKSHAAHAGHHDEQSKYRNKGYYERDRGYHYEKAYAYDRVREHHDIEKTHDAHTDHKAQHSNQGHYAKGHKDGHGYVYFNKADHHGAHGHGKHGYHLDKSGHHKNGYHAAAHVQHPVTYAHSAPAYGSAYAKH